MNNFKLKIFSLLKHLPEKIVASVEPVAFDHQATEGIEHVKITENGVDVDPEFWIGRFHRKDGNWQSL